MYYMNDDDDFSFWFMLCMASCCLLMTGCAAPVINARVTAADGTEVVKPVELNREGAWALVNMEKERTKQAQAAAEAEKHKAAAAKAPQWNISDKDTALAYGMHKANESLGEVARELAKKPEADSTVPMPKSAFAEGVEAVGSAVVKVANSPAAVAGVVGATVAKVATEGIRGAGDEVHAGRDAILEDVKTKKSASTTGDESPLTITKEKTADHSTQDDHSVTDDHSTVDDHGVTQ